MNQASHKGQNRIRRIALFVLICLMMLTTACGLKKDLYLPSSEPAADQPVQPETKPSEDDSVAPGRRTGTGIPH